MELSFWLFLRYARRSQAAIQLKFKEAK